MPVSGRRRMASRLPSPGIVEAMAVPRHYQRQPETTGKQPTGSPVSCISYGYETELLGEYANCHRPIAARIHAACVLRRRALRSVPDTPGVPTTNASAVAALLPVRRLWHITRPRPRLLRLLSTGEEDGLLVVRTL